MSKYLKAFRLYERWEMFKSEVSHVSSLTPFIEAIENLSKDPSKENIETVRQLDVELSDIVEKLDKEDKEVFEDMLLRILFQGYRTVDKGFSRWNFTMERAEAKGLISDFDRLNDVINKSEQEAVKYSNSGLSPEKYTSLQEEYLKTLDDIWDKTKEKIEKRTSPRYEQFFTQQVNDKRKVIVRHVEHFEGNEFGLWIQSLRQSKGWSLRQAGEMTGVSSSYIHRMERGRRGTPSTTKLEQLAIGYGVPYNTMLVMASGNLKPLDTYIAESEFLINGELTPRRTRNDFSELIRLVVENADDDEVLAIVAEIRKGLNTLNK